MNTMTLKEIPLMIQSASPKDRAEAFKLLTEVATSKELPEQGLKTALRLLLLTLPRYQDNESRHHVKCFIVAVVKQHGLVSLENLIHVFHDYSSTIPSVNTPNIGRTNFTGLTWLVTSIQSLPKDADISLLQEGDAIALIESFAALYTSIALCGQNLLLQKASKMLHCCWKRSTSFLSLTAERIHKSDCGGSLLAFGGCFLKCLVDDKQTELVQKCKGSLVDGFVSHVISQKTEPSTQLVALCAPFLRVLDHPGFQALLLPNLKKFLLRNPEIILPTVSETLAGLSLDLSQYALEFGKIFATNLHSNEERTRVHAVKACRSLARQCSDAEIIAQLLRHFFAVLQGSEGKLTVAAHKISMLQGIGELSHNSALGVSMQGLASEACEHFIKVLETEDQKDKIIFWEPAQKGPTLKSSTSAIRNGYIRVMESCFHTRLLSQAKEFLPFLMKTVEKAAQQPTQVAVVTEGLSASVLVLRLLAAEPEADSQACPFWNIAGNMEKQIFLNEKFLQQASTDALHHVVLYSKSMVMEHDQHIQGEPQPIHHALVYVMTHVSGVGQEKLWLRTQVVSETKKILQSLGGEHIALAVLEDLSTYLETVNVKVPEPGSRVGKDSKDQGQGQGAATGTSSSPEILASSVAHALAIIVLGCKVSIPEADELLLAALLPAHSPAVVETHRDLWLSLCRKLKRKPADFCEANESKLLCFCSQQFNGSLYMQVTQEEYEIFKTPEGTLYQKSVIENLKEESILNVKNIKRESKAYSYKEQMEELELRRELEAKKKQKGLMEEGLTPKQKEAMKIQLEKESAIRAHLKSMYEEFQNPMHLLEAGIQGNSLSLECYLVQILEHLLPLLSSPLCAPDAAHTFLLLRSVVFDKSHDCLGKSIGHVTLRLLGPRCDLDPEWEEEDLASAAGRVMASLHTYSVEQPEDLDAPTFTYCFPFLNAALHRFAPQELDLTLKALKVMSMHCHLREEDTSSPFHPGNMPLGQMLELLTTLIGTSGGQVQLQACSVMVDIAEAMSGRPDCARMSGRELVVLLHGLQSSVSAVREASLRVLTIVAGTIKETASQPEESLRVAKRIWVARFDPEGEIRSLANNLWDKMKFSIPQEVLIDAVMEDVTHVEQVIREAAAKSLAALCQENLKLIPSIMERLLDSYQEKLMMIPGVKDDFGREIAPPMDCWEPRWGVAHALHGLAPLLDPDSIVQLMSFLLQDGLRDRHPDVRHVMLDVALGTVNSHGKDMVSQLLPLFESFLDKIPKTQTYDTVRQSIVIIMGSLAKHLDKDDPRVKPIIAKLIESLSTPSQQVQEAVANCLPPLVPAIKEDAPMVVEKLLHLLLESENYGERKGAAYGVAGLVKGLGILALKQLEIMNRLTAAIQDKKNYRHREGSLFAFEMLCNMLGRLFEPYIVHVLPHLLLCFGDSNQYVREATDDCAKAVMSRLSAHGVKLVLPSLLAALEGDSWRTKTGSVELLGAMAFCAPKQLSSCLPSIVPKLIEVLGDSHPKVQKAGTQALSVIASVIRNPEIQAIVPNLLGALEDPSKKTAPCLQTLLDTKFVHFIDAPSLALIMPVVQRAFQDRSTETRKMAAQIIGNMYSLTDQKDLQPYLPAIIPGLKTSLLDPVPEVRSVSARALGAMVKGMGEGSFEDLLPWLMQTLTSERGSVDRSGAAQGLSEVVGGLGPQKLHRLMPDIIATAERADIAPHVKDGYIMMFIYLPVVFKQEFTPYVSQIIVPILKALADETEYVRETALKAGQRIVSMYADTAIMLLLPELERGLFDDNWRIRYSSVQLLGDLLYKISGVSGKMSTETADEDDNFGTEQSQRAVLHVLGEDRRNRVLAGLYMGRSDVALMVRQASLHVWKVVVTNTPRMLREILPTLFSLLLGCLASTSYDKRQVAARTLGDLVRKLGERVLPEIIPILERGLESEQADQRQGVCIGLSEIMASTSRDMILLFVESLVPTVRRALCDPLPEVRQAAARTFDSLHNTVGGRALDDILSPMLHQLNDPELAEWTLDGLRQVMAIKSKIVLPYLIPQVKLLLLTQPPVNTEALSILASVSGEALTRHLSRILPALLQSLSQALGTPQEAQEMGYCQAVVLSVQDDMGTHVVIDHLLEVARSTSPPGTEGEEMAEALKQKQAAILLLAAFLTHTKCDYSTYVPQLLRGLVHLFTDEDATILAATWDGLNAITKGMDSKTQIERVSDMRQAVKYAASDLKGRELLPGFCLPKGIAPILPILREAILNGAPEQKEQAALGFGEVIRLTSPEALKPSVVNITGPLIRILGDRFSWNIKVPVLDTLALLLTKVGSQLRPFLPQLQTTFLKALNDGHRTVRLRAAQALSCLIVIHVRADPLFTDLHSSIKSADDPAVMDTMLYAMRCVVSSSGDKMGDGIRKTILSTLLGLVTSVEDSVRLTAAGCLGALCHWLKPDELSAVLTDHILNDDLTKDWLARHWSVVALSVILKESPNTILQSDWNEKVNRVIFAYLTADRVPIVMAGVRCCGFLLMNCIQESKPIPEKILVPFCRTMNHSSNEVKQLVAVVAGKLASCVPGGQPLPPEILRLLLPQLVNGTKEKNSAVRASSEAALVAVLRLRVGEETQQHCLRLLEEGAQEALSEVISKVLRRVALQPQGKEEELDDTLLT
ncbi:unnamed protein product [Darwinula stevensoni]|uniref:TOG domain-containing protein n=1 Tax=Darwinula stevensoni TaxID=69355 RepID=A0A7R8XBU7_9CRUS|nr:unnamed protein product [Darwinula stevensoni]CAG0888179.1 unnamed protein product [Darwinula stevensoni]